jgi:hypothetical protein
VLHPRGQQVGPEHFGIICVDCAKARSRFLLADFYGRILIAPTTVGHNRPELEAAVAQVVRAFVEHQLGDGLHRHRTHRPLIIARPAHLRRRRPRDAHPAPLRHQAVSPARRPRQQDRRHRPGRHPPRHVAADLHRRIALAYYRDRQQKSEEIQALERDIASRPVQTPYILLLSFPGINVVSAADFAREMGPISDYANPKSITAAPACGHPLSE